MLAGSLGALALLIAVSRSLVSRPNRSRSSSRISMSRMSVSGTRGSTYSLVGRTAGAAAACVTAGPTGRSGRRAMFRASASSAGRLRDGCWMARPLESSCTRRLICSTSSRRRRCWALARNCRPSNRPKSASSAAPSSISGEAPVAVVAGWKLSFQCGLPLASGSSGPLPLPCWSSTFSGELSNCCVRRSWPASAGTRGNVASRRSSSMTRSSVPWTACSAEARSGAAL